MLAAALFFQKRMEWTRDGVSYDLDPKVLSDPDSPDPEHHFYAIRKLRRMSARYVSAEDLAYRVEAAREKFAEIFRRLGFPI